MSWHTPERKTEAAMQLYFATVLGYELTGVQIATRFSNDELTEPRIEIVCENCVPYPEGMQVDTGNWLMTVRVSVYSHYETSVDAEAHDEIIGNLLDVLLVGDSDGNNTTVAQINLTQGESDFTVQELEVKERSNRVEDHSLITEQELEMIISPSRL